MKHLTPACLALCLGTSAVEAATFDAAYMVATPGSTDAVTEFSLDGPAPWLFVDLPALGSFFTVVESDWFRVGVAGLQFSATPSQQQNDRFWIAPSASTWANAKALGNWSVTASFELVGILFAENGGIGVGISEGAGSTEVGFAVVPAPVPLPASGLLLGPALLALGILRRSSRPRGA